MAAGRHDDLHPRILPLEDRILILGETALYRLHPESEAWTATTAEEGLPDPPLRRLYVGDDHLWVGGRGAALSDLRFDDWQRYQPGQGLPGREVRCLEADADYAYAGTDQGAARFDLYILEWESLPGPDGADLGTVSDLAVGEDRVWFALDGGVAEYRKDSESVRVDSTLGGLDHPRVLALRRSQEYLWAVCAQGIARYDVDLRTWTSFRSGVDLPDARIYQATLQGEDLWLGTSQGLWRYRADSGIWRRDEANEGMPGQEVRSFALESDRIWAVTEDAFALYEVEAARWIDFSAAVPLEPGRVRQMARVLDTLVYLGQDRVVYGLQSGQANPSLFTYRAVRIEEAAPEEAGQERDWSLGWSQSGLGYESRKGTSLHVRGGATIYIEDDDGSGGGDLENFQSETRYDMTLNGKLGQDRTLSGFYDTTDPDNEAYELTYRGGRDDLVRLVSVGEVEQELYNAALAPGTGLRGGQARLEVGPRSAETRRRALTLDGWAGERRTLPGRDVFEGGSREIAGSVPDIGYAAGLVFAPPLDWSRDDVRRSRLYRDDGTSSTDDGNTEHRTLAGREGSWDLLRPNEDYVLGSRGGSWILASPLGAAEALVTVRQDAREAPAALREATGKAPAALREATGKAPAALREATGDAVDLTGQSLRNRYWIAVDPVPGTVEIALRDTLGALEDAQGHPYLERFGLDSDGDGRLDPDRFSPVTGLLSFPDSLPFPEEVYGNPPLSLYEIEFSYRARLHTYRLSRRNLVSGSERITLDRELLRPKVDYTLIPSSGLFILFEHVLVDDDSVIEVEYRYEASQEESDALVVAGQIGAAPADFLFLGAHGTRWEDEVQDEVLTGGLTGRLEWKGTGRLLRISPELAWSRLDAPGGSEQGAAAGISAQGREGPVEFSASHRSLEAEYRSFEDRRTLLGRLRQDSQAEVRWTPVPLFQAEVDWNRRESALEDSSAKGRVAAKTLRGDQVGGMDDGSANDVIIGSVEAASEETGSEETGSEETLLGTLRLLRGGWPNLEVKGGRILIDSPEERRETWIRRAEMEINPDPERIQSLGIRRLWLRGFFQRSEREFQDPGGEESNAERNSAAMAGAQGIAESGGGSSTLKDSAPRIGSDAAIDPRGQSHFKRTTDHAFLRLNGSVGTPLAWNLALEDRRTFDPEAEGDGRLSRRQDAEATFQAQPHSSLDAYLRWEGERELYWLPQGGSGGFAADRLLLATLQVYPGRLRSALNPLTLRLERSRGETDQGEPGRDLPGSEGLWSRDGDPSLARDQDQDVLEGRLELRSWLRWVERWEWEDERETREGLGVESSRREVESRVEIDPTGGRITLRWIDALKRELTTRQDQTRLTGQWDQTWGRGFLTYLFLDASRMEIRDRQAGQDLEEWSPQLRLTWRRNWWHLDANLGGSLGWTRTRPAGRLGRSSWDEERRQSLSASVNLQPHPVLGFRIQYLMTRSDDGSSARAEADHDLKVRIQIRA